MILLLDSHALIWWTLTPEKVSQHASELLDDNSNELFLSIASIWEMQIKLQLGKLRLDLPLPDLIESQIQNNNLQILPIELSQIWALEGLPNYNKNPFDRILIAQAIALKIPLLSIDSIFDNYPVQRL